MPAGRSSTHTSAESDIPAAEPQKAPTNVTYGRRATMPVLATDTYADVVLPDLAEFDVKSIPLDATIVAVGKRRTGKTWVLRNLMYEKRLAFTGGIVFSQTDRLNQFWQQYVPSAYIYSKYDPAILQLVFKRQLEIRESNRLTEQEKEKALPFFILLDDVISDPKLKFDEQLIELFVSGRHYKLFVLITTQYAKSITPTLRGNTDFCFVMRTIQERQLESLYDDFANFLTRDAWHQIVKDNTQDNEVLVIDTCNDIDKEPLQMLHWWKAIDPGPFLMGTKAYWESAMQNRDAVPPAPGQEAAAGLLTVADIAPRLWQPAMASHKF